MRRVKSAVLLKLFSRSGFQSIVPIIHVEDEDHQLIQDHRFEEIARLVFLSPLLP
jgi:hypothetical protein